MRNKFFEILGRFSGKGVYPHQLAWMLLLPFRNFYLSPRQLVSRLGLKSDSIVLEIGPGPGYFSPIVAKNIPQGQLYLTDIQPEMLEKARKRIAKANVTNVEFRLCDGNSLPYPDNFVDIIFLVTVLGEISNQKIYISEMLRILRKGGRISISEQGGDPDSIRPEEVHKLFLSAGFLPETVFGKGRTFTANFIKK